MKMIRLEKQTAPRFDELFAMIGELRDFLDEEANINDRDWNRSLNEILDFQDDDGSFALLTQRGIPSDARVDFIHIPTYLCTAILMKAYLTDSEAFTLREKRALADGLKSSCARKLRGHGYDAFKSQIEALDIFMKAGLNEFIDLHADLCPEFSEMINSIAAEFRQRESEGNFLGPWHESYEAEIKAVNEYFCHRNMFVYGTLMSGETNHHYLKSSELLGKATIEGYDMYDVGWYPAIVPGNNMILGELYRVCLEDMPSIDALEGEGHLYIKGCERTTDAKGNKTFALVYIYLGDTSNLRKIPTWKEYVWYVSYGSNMLKERFLCYIKGGHYRYSRNYDACSDTSLPLAVKTVEIPYDMYFGNHSGTWGGGVSFLDTTKNGKALGVAYLITREQFDHVATEENNGRYPGGGDWYEDIIDLGMMDGFEVITLTNNSLRPYNEPVQDYWNTLFDGIRQNWPDMSDEEIEDYLRSCLRG